MIQTMILCAGRGTRLLPLTANLPKPLVPLGDRPLLAHIVERLERAGGQLRAINAHHQSVAIQGFVDRFDQDVFVSVEGELLGTAGGVCCARQAFDLAPLLIWNGDILAEPNISALVDRLAFAQLVLLVEPDAKGQGNVGTNAAGQVVRLRKCSIAEEASGGHYTGIMLVHPDCFARLPAQGCLIGDVAIPMLRAGLSVAAVSYRDKWVDIGTLSSYLKENLEWAATRDAQRRNFIDRNTTIADSVQFRRVVIGQGATVTGEGELDRVVVWPGASCSAPLSDAIVTPTCGVVPVP
jgi:mannose-1-phosphate guanylyltransferase